MNFLAGVLAASGPDGGGGGRLALTGPQRRAVGEQRVKGCVSDLEHEEVLRALGVDPRDVGLSHAADPPTAASNDAPASCCVVCLDAPPALACVPCGHVCLCDACGQALAARAAARFKCPVCRLKVQCTMRVYLCELTFLFLGFSKCICRVGTQAQYMSRSTLQLANGQ